MHFLTGKRQGKGQLHLSDGSRYTGHFDQGMCSGPGVIEFADGSK